MARHEPTLKIARSELGDAWPFTVKRVGIARVGEALVITSGGKQYAGNGTARGQLGLPTPDPIWSIVGRYEFEGKRLPIRADVGLFIAYALSRTMRKT